MLVAIRILLILMIKVTCKPLTPNFLSVMDNNSNGKLYALAIGGAAAMGGLFFFASMLTGYELPADTLSKVATPLQSFMGWFLLIFFSSLIIWGLGRMSSRISDRWFLSLPLSIFVIVAVMFVSLELVWEKGRTTTIDGKSIRTVRQLDAFNDGEDFENIEDQPVEEAAAGGEALGTDGAAAPAVAAEESAGPVEEVILTGDELAEADKLFQRRCTRCHAVKAVENKLVEYRKKGQSEKIVLDMKDWPNSGIRGKDVPTLVNYINSIY